MDVPPMRVIVNYQRVSQFRLDKQALNCAGRKGTVSVYYVRRTHREYFSQAEQEIAALTRFDTFPPLEREAGRADAIRKRAELLFYRSSEIAARASLLNEKIKPDLTICLHFNAVEWDDCQFPRQAVFFVSKAGDVVCDDVNDSHPIWKPRT